MVQLIIYYIFELEDISSSKGQNKYMTSSVKKSTKNEFKSIEPGNKSKTLDDI